jgi:D-alanyl-D-alanine carboxypeptidase (penicillin-binding protein 5/6)
VSLPVLQPVERRRHRRRRRRSRALVVLTVAAAGAFASGLAMGRVHDGPRSAAASPPPAKIVRTAPRRAAEQPLLLAAAAPRHAFVPRLTASSAILVDARSGRVVWALRPHARRLAASTTKIMTAVLALDRLRPHEVVTVARSVPRVPLVKEGLRAGERVQAWKLFYGLLLYSGNDDALALAIGSAGSRAEFVSLMNLEARRLGLHDSHFSSPSGVIDRDNYSSSWDLAALTRYALRNPRFRAIVRTSRKEVAWTPPTFAKVYLNKNLLLTTFRGADGVKTGWTTKAGHCLVASAHRGNERLIAVVLHARDPYGDTRRLLGYGFRLAR